MGKERLSLEVKVGLVVTFAVAMVVAFLVLLGEYNPFSSAYTINMTLDYAGGIKPGSDVHLAGAKVGKVESIRFPQAPAAGEPNLSLVLLIDKRAKKLIRKDSTFSVHMESLLGGKIVEISPGTIETEVLDDGAVVKGIDPPRMEALISEAINLLEQIKSFTDGLTDDDRERLRRLLSTLASLGPEDVEELRRLLKNAADASEDLAAIAGEVRPEVGPLLEKAETTLDDAGPLISETRTTLQEARALLRQVDGMIAELRELSPEDGEAFKDKVGGLLDAADDLVRVADRLDRFTARMETELEGVSRQDLEKWLRQFLQQEGITVNVGTVVGKPDYPPPE